MMGSLSEHNLSYWVTSTDSPSFAGQPLAKRAEVCVIGGGITGLLTAYLLLAEGKQVTLIEAGKICSGVTGYTTGKVTSQHGAPYAGLFKKHGEDVARTYANAQQAGLELIADVAREIPCDFTRADAHVFTDAADRVRELEEEAAVANALGLPVSFSRSAAVPFPVAGVVRFENQAWFHPRKFCIGLAQAIVAAGGSIAEDTRALDVDGTDPCRVQLIDGEIEADAVVVATQLPFLSSGLFFARTKPMRSYVVAGRTKSPLKDMFISLDEPKRSFRPHESQDGDSIMMIGGGGHPTGREANTEHEYEQLEAFARDWFGIEPEWKWSAQDFVTHDGLPFVGEISKLGRQVYVATGFSKWGMTNAAAAARSITNSIMGRGDDWAEAAAANRIGVLESLGTMASQGFETVKSLVGDNIKTLLSSEGIEDLGPGEAGIVKMNGARVAAFRDEDGEVHAVSPECTHLGCVVSFNDAERSWDCPCHGSRFGLDGRVLNGPATKDLERISLVADENSD